ncbi:hypothetical protein HN371_29660 [Candidatus Poribacteria bacterium]|jgi:hypothetical protein|nr:hypothetical protein [Candidatus Poribacteria bacterium]MBT5535618.1 hypothetical protein [Candidatus Poribacteria bacterium]MBT5710319.1 hypothetical protein [Candidatus Poribacteria bacterium]MBT7099406.1 hypothetical protein [Candidatus Poribacteria bacterium]MBT7808378.1 hypothetical protein [Candidatus Poribacteria bacterium]
MATDSLLTIRYRLADAGVHEPDAWTMGELLRLVRAHAFEDDPTAAELRRRIREALPNRVPDAQEPTGEDATRAELAYRIAGKYASALRPSEAFARDKADEIAREHRRE